jgi:UDP-N-acetyl-2-amino-2-deoxyglucuronate dehydrogenase
MGTSAVRIGLVGCGRISQYHFDAIGRIDGLELAAVADVDRPRAVAAGRARGVPAFGSLEEMLATATVDAVAICTPSGLHPEHGIQVARAGKHVISEKPIGLSLDGSDALISACDAAGVHLFVVKQNRLNPPIQLLKRAVDRGRFGRIFMGNVTVRWQRPPEYYRAESWRGTERLDGGAMTNQGSHYVDLLQWLMGPARSVVAVTATQARDIETEDSGAAIVHFASGAIGVIEVNVLTYPKNYEGSLTIIGETGTVRIGGTSVNRVEHWAFADYDDDDKVVESGLINTAPPSVYGFGHEGYYRNVLATLRGEPAAATNGREARKSMEIILAAYESARVHRAVPITGITTP